MIATILHPGGVIVPVLAQPGAKRTGVIGERAGALRVAVTAAPERGKANAAVQSVLAEALGCKAGQITLLSGESSRRKRFLIGGITSGDLTRRLESLIAHHQSSPSKP